LLRDRTKWRRSAPSPDHNQVTLPFCGDLPNRVYCSTVLDQGVCAIVQSLLDAYAADLVGYFTTSCFFLSRQECLVEGDILFRDGREPLSFDHPYLHDVKNPDLRPLLFGEPQACSKREDRLREEVGSD
jgi:hypothetical protein